MKVRALPTWRNPVGEGAKRTRGGFVEESVIGGRFRVIGVSMLRFEEKERQAERFAVSQVILSSEECKQTSGPQRLKPQFLRSYRHD